MDIIQSLDAQIVSNEKYYKLKDLLVHLNGLRDLSIEVEDYVLTPYYISVGKRMELYEYELKISADTQQSFEEYMLNLTGKQDLNEISSDVMQRQKMCYIECKKNTYKINVNQLKKYMNFLLSSESIQKQIEKCFGIFDNDNMFFEIY